MVKRDVAVWAQLHVLPRLPYLHHGIGPPGGSEATPHIDSSITLIYRSQVGTNQKPGPDIQSYQPNPFLCHTHTHKTLLLRPWLHFSPTSVPSCSLSKRSPGTISDFWAPEPRPGLQPGPCRRPLSPAPALSPSVFLAVSAWLSLPLSVRVYLCLLQAGRLQRRLHKSGGADRVWVWGGHSVSLLEPYQES